MGIFLFIHPSLCSRGPSIFYNILFIFKNFPFTLFSSSGTSVYVKLNILDTSSTMPSFLNYFFSSSSSFSFWVISSMS